VAHHQRLYREFLARLPAHSDCQDQVLFDVKDNTTYARSRPGNWPCAPANNKVVLTDGCGHVRQ
jgi:hypothetical protein